MRKIVYGVAASAIAAGLVACSDPTAAPAARAFDLPSLSPLAATIGTPSTVRRDLEGQVWVCKTANSGAPLQSFDFTYSATKPVGSSQPDLLPGSFSIKNGECALIYEIDKEISVGRYVVTVTEGAMPNANWAFTTATSSSIAPFSATLLGTPVVTGQSISNVGFIHDQGAIITFNNTYTAPTGQIGDFVWDDQNANGVQDSGEPGLAGVKVDLAGSATASTTTNASGFYSFTGLSAGSYTVTVDPTTLPAGYTGTLTGQGTPSTDNNGATANVTLATSSSSDLTIDFGYVNATGQIGDFVWNDVNGNGVQDSGEPGLAGVKVNLTGAATASATTNASGFYSFTGLRAGSYTVTVDGTTIPAGFSAAPTGQGTAGTDNNGSPANVTLATNSSVDLTIDFGYTSPTGQIGDFVWNDVNGNGVQDSGEPGLAGVKVNLTGAATASATTNASGFYSFTGLRAGSYTVTVDGTTIPAGFSPAPTGQGTAGTDNNGSPASVSLVANNSVDLTIDFGYTSPTGQIGNFVWNDLNGNGVQDSGEPGLAGVKVNLTGTATASATTNASGFYSFGSLRAGSYTVTVDGTTLPAGFAATLTGQGTLATDSNGSPANVSLAANNSVDLTIDFGFRALSGPKCSLTLGYWKTHQSEWDTLGERIVWTGQTFFKSGITYSAIYALNAAGGNSYVQLAHQYIAAKLNVNGGSDPTINSAIAQAEALLNGHTVGSTFIKNSTWTALASTLDDYNNGRTGPGHCN